MEFVPPDFDAEQQREAEQKVAEVAARISLPTGRVSAVVILGSVYDDVLPEAERSAADLIVVFSHRLSMATYTHRLECRENRAARQVLGPGGAIRAQDARRPVMTRLALGLVLALVPSVSFAVEPRVQRPHLRPGELRPVPRDRADSRKPASDCAAVPDTSRALSRRYPRRGAGRGHRHGASLDARVPSRRGADQ